MANLGNNRVVEADVGEVVEEDCVTPFARETVVVTVWLAVLESVEVEVIVGEPVIDAPLAETAAVTADAEAEEDEIVDEAAEDTIAAIEVEAVDKVIVGNTALDETADAIEVEAGNEAFVVDATLDETVDAIEVETEAGDEVSAVEAALDETADVIEVETEDGMSVVDAALDETVAAIAEDEVGEIRFVGDVTEDETDVALVTAEFVEKEIVGELAETRVEEAETLRLMVAMLAVEALRAVVDCTALDGRGNDVVGLWKLVTKLETAEGVFAELVCVARIDELEVVLAEIVAEFTEAEPTEEEEGRMVPEGAARVEETKGVEIEATAEVEPEDDGEGAELDVLVEEIEIELGFMSNTDMAALPPQIYPSLR
ncbi:hypothetical protein HDU98_001658 [Podochytrium sp. JEL0797]|nr:hypothetical protein HDU98_001658 [Podochytrium sp. JEL0797]